MSRVSDHIRRDAEHAARAEIAILLSKYQRRLYEEAKTHISTALTEAEPGAVLDGTTVGREAVDLAVAHYLGAGEVTGTLGAGEAADDPAEDPRL